MKTKVTYVQEYSVESMQASGFEITDDSTHRQIDDGLFKDRIISRFSDSPVKQEVVKKLFDGYNFSEIGRDMQMTASQIYKIKSELEKDLAFLRDPQQAADFVEKNRDRLKTFFHYQKFIVSNLKLTQFIQNYIYDYDQEAEAKGWRTTELQNTMSDIWDKHPRTRILAPRDHLKTFTLLSYILKKVVQRDYPMEIDYYHLVDELAIQKFRAFQRSIEKNPILYEWLRVSEAKYWSEDAIELFDGTTIRPLSYQSGSVGKHPHIIALDDVIDKKVMYSDTQNKKAIDRFMLDIYPQISKDDPDKKIMLIGTIQRNDDLYHSLPSDFKTFTFSSVDEEKKTVLSPEIYTYKRLMQIKDDIVKNGEGTSYWLKEYQNVVSDAKGLIIKGDWLRYYEDIPKSGTRVQGWDLSVGRDPEKNDWTARASIEVCEEAGEIVIYVKKIERWRIDFDSRLVKIENEFILEKPSVVGIEDQVFQYDTVTAMKRRTMIPIVGVHALKNKVESFKTELAPYFESGRIRIHVSLKDSDFTKELLSLPAGEFDDMCDALKIAIKTYIIGSNVPRIRRL